jgi:FG-GAP-like repeat
VCGFAVETGRSLHNAEHFNLAMTERVHVKSMKRAIICRILVAALLGALWNLIAPLAIAADKIVHSVSELDDTLHDRTFLGRVIIPKDSIWHMERCDKQRDEFGNFVCAPVLELPLYSGVTLMGERGELGSRPLLFTTLIDKASSRALFEVCGNNVRVEGLHLRGPQTGENHGIKLPYFHGILVFEAAGKKAASPCVADNTAEVKAPILGQLGRNVVIADNELEQWTGGAVSTRGVHGNIPLKDWAPHTCEANAACCGDPDGTFPADPDDDICWKPLTFADAGLVRVERNFMHHNARDDGGYGVDVNGGSFVTITGNVFNYNRHAVTATGRGHSGYVARFNYVLQGGYRQNAGIVTDGYYNQHMDVHGEGSGGYGGAAGTQFDISLNTFRGEQKYYQVRTRPAFMQRGTPAIGIDFRDNVAVHDSLNKAVRFKDFSSGGPPDSLIGQTKAKFHPAGNRFDTDTVRDLAAGDFDGDGVTDIFIANGTAWFYSRGGKRSWEFLHASTKRIDELAFADIDNDGVTDVLYRDPQGNVGMLRSGREDLVPLTTSPVPIKDTRSGDFDGDGKTDLFITHQGLWRIFRGSTHLWTPGNSSNKPISELLFGEFDRVRGTDVAAVQSGGWVVSTAANSNWNFLNIKLADTFKRAIAADFDGNGLTDIAFTRLGRWNFSPDGRGQPRLLGMPAVARESGVIGRFDKASPRAMMIHNPPDFLGFYSRHFKIWRGNGTTGDFRDWSDHDMR